MSDFYAMIKEALAGADDTPPAPDRAALDASVRAFERRMRTMRALTAFQLVFAAALVVTGVVLIVQLDAAASARQLLAYASIVAMGMTIIGFAKLWYLLMLNHTAVMKELKRVQLRLLCDGLDRA